MINLGKYDQKLTFQSFGQVPDGYGGYIPTATAVLTTFARSIQLRGSNSLEQAQLTLPKTYTFGIQIRAGFEPNTSMQMLYKGKNHAITGVSISEERGAREWIITAITL
jgi:SPP1 family predicted phage head-tail adaptor